MIADAIVNTEHPSSKHVINHQLDSLGNPQMPMISSSAMTARTEDSASSMQVPPDTGEPYFNVGIVLHHSTTSDLHISAMSKPASLCHVTSLVVLNPPSSQQSEALQTFFDTHNLGDQANYISIGWGENGFRELLKQENVHALYIIVPPGTQRNYVLASLQAGKHVLLKDTVSTHLAEFKEQLEFANRFKKFVQFSTMFVHQYRVLRLMERVLREKRFGRINSIDASLSVNYDDIEKVGVKLPLGPNEGSIRVLGRFCVLVGTLIFTRVGSHAISAKVTSLESSGASCSVDFTDGRKLTFNVEYTQSNTRQSIKVQADSRYATMTDFVIEHPDGLASYRVYEKAMTGNGIVEVVSGEAIDVTGGPTQDVMMWRTFVKLSNCIDEEGWEETPNNAECRELGSVALQTKRILIALVKSSQNSCQEVRLEDIDDQ